MPLVRPCTSHTGAVRGVGRSGGAPQTSMHSKLAARAWAAAEAKGQGTCSWTGVVWGP